jgi:aspartyl-tRNA(Asn)/glutamyl-tRNA(Gln) amidotransferase subunit B
MGLGMTAIDLNRAGTPLIEIVSEPDMTTSSEAVAFAKKLHSIVTSLGICDGEMSQGSMRFDVNISVRPKGQEELGTRTETKNLNSYKFMEEAIALEVERQIDVIEDGGKILQQTRLYDADTKSARSMRSKEDANDYRYFPCPDLLPVILDDDFIQEIRDNLPELPEARRARFVSSYNLSSYDSSQLAENPAIANFFEECNKLCDDAKLSANWVMGEVSANLNADNISIQNSPVSAEQLAGVISRIKDGTISNKIAKQVFDALWIKEGIDADSIIDAKGLKQVSDTGALGTMIDEVIANNQKQVANFQKADACKRPKMLGFFVGQIMKLSKGQANPQLVNQLLTEKLNQVAKK